MESQTSDESIDDVFELETESMALSRALTKLLQLAPPCTPIDPLRSESSSNDGGAVEIQTRIDKLNDLTLESDDEDDVIASRFQRLMRSERLSTISLKSATPSPLAPLQVGEKQVLSFDELVRRWEHSRTSIEANELSLQIQRVLKNQRPSELSVEEIFLSEVIERYYQLQEQVKFEDKLAELQSSLSDELEHDMSDKGIVEEAVEYELSQTDPPGVDDLAEIVHSNAHDEATAPADGDPAIVFDDDLAVRLQKLTGVAPAVLLSDIQLEILARTLLGLPTDPPEPKHVVSDDSLELSHLLAQLRREHDSNKGLYNPEDDIQSADLSMQLADLRRAIDDPSILPPSDEADLSNRLKNLRDTLSPRLLSDSEMHSRLSSFKDLSISQSSDPSVPTDEELALRLEALTGCTPAVSLTDSQLAILAKLLTETREEIRRNESSSKLDQRLED